MARSRKFSLRKSADAQAILIAESLVLGGFVLLAVLLGGASAGGFAANGILQLLGAAVIAFAIARFDPRNLTGAERSLWLLLVALAVLMMIQLVPLPPAMWTALPGRDPVIETFGALGIEPLPWMPLSLTPARTLAALVALLPPMAVLVLVARSNRTAAQAALWALFGVVVLSVLMGLAQLSGGAGSPLYLYTITNAGAAVGFFSNTNHLSTLMLIALPLAAGVAARAKLRASGKAGGTTIVWMTLLLMSFLALMGLLLGGSLAGLLLMPVALIGGFLVFRTVLSRRATLWFVIGLGVSVALALGVVLLSPGITDFGTTSFGGSGMDRSYLWSVTGEAVRATFPAGSGFGSLEQVFRQFEDPATVGRTFANHAHSDLLEFVLESGVIGALLLLGFLLWYVGRTWMLWTDEQARDPVARGASVAVLLVLAHSLVDYPLRTAAIAVPFALCCALMARPPRSAQQPAAPASAPGGRHLAA